MTIIMPEHVSVMDNTKVALMTSVANLAAPSLATEINASSSLDVTCFVVGGFAPTVQPSTAYPPPRLCGGLSLPVRGRSQLQPIRVRYVFHPQEADTTDNNKAKAFLAEGVLFFAMVRRGLPALTDAFTAAEKVQTWRFEAGPQNEIPSGDDDGAIWVVEQDWLPKAMPVPGVIAA